MNRAIASLIIAAAIAALLGSLRPGLALADAPRVVVRAEAVVQGETIWLSDIAEVRGDGASQSLLLSLARVSLGPAPRPGASRTLSQGAITTRIRGAIGDVPAEVPERVTITRAAAFISLGEIEAGVMDWAQGALGDVDAHISLQSLSFKEPIPVPTDLLSHGVEGVSQGLPLGSVSLQVVIQRPEGRVERIPFTARLEVEAPVVVLQRAVRRGQTLSEKDLGTEVQILSRGVAPILDPEAAIGLQASRALQAGTTLTEQALVLPPDVAEGEPLTLIIRSGGLRVTVPGEARDDGRIGDLIPVYCPSTRTQLRGHLIENGVVEIPFLGATQLDGDRR